MQEGEKFKILRQLVKYKQQGWEIINKCKDKERGLCLEDISVVSPPPEKMNYKVGGSSKSPGPLFTHYESLRIQICDKTAEKIFYMIGKILGIEKKVSFS